MTRHVFSCAFGCAFALAVACSSDDSSERNDFPEPEAPDGGGDADVATNPAVMLVAQVYTPDDYLTYVGAFPEVPEGEVDFGKLREFGNANASANGGYIFIEQDGVVKRFSVNEKLELVDGPSFSWQDFGVASVGASYTVFVSDSRAYTFAPELGVIIIWDPEAMELTGEIEVDLGERGESGDIFAYDGRLVGDKVIWNMFSGDWEQVTLHPAVTLVIADAESDDPVRVVEDDRCLPGGPSFVDGRGDYYVHGGAFFGYFYVYGDVAEDARTCILRVRAGEEEIDPDYLADYEELTGSYVNDSWYLIEGQKYYVRAWDAEVDFPEDIEDFYIDQPLRSVLVDLEAETVEPYPDLEGTNTIDGYTRIVDGVSYFQLSETGYVEGGHTDVVALKPDGIEHKFHLAGFLLGLERLR